MLGSNKTGLHDWNCIEGMVQRKVAGLPTVKSQREIRQRVMKACSREIDRLENAFLDLHIRH